MNDAARVRRVESAGGLDAGVEQVVKRERAAGDVLLQRVAVRNSMTMKWRPSNSSIS